MVFLEGKLVDAEAKQEARGIEVHLSLESLESFFLGCSCLFLKFSGFFLLFFPGFLSWLKVFFLGFS